MMLLLLLINVIAIVDYLSSDQTDRPTTMTTRTVKMQVNGSRR